MNDGFEKEVMKKMRTSLVANKRELLDRVKNRAKNPKIKMNNVLGELVNKGWIIPLYGSETTFAITQKGMKESK
jgi:hypothetical protein